MGRNNVIDLVGWVGNEIERNWRNTRRWRGRGAGGLSLCECCYLEKKVYGVNKSVSEGVQMHHINADLNVRLRSSSE